MHHLIVYVKKEVHKHLFDYILFITAGIFFLISLNIFKGERLIEFLILLIFTSFYIIWGLYHHVIQNTLHLKTVLEYILIGFTILFLLKVIILP
jgi:hypothetical protein